MSSRMTLKSVLLAGAALATTPAVGLAQEADTSETPSKRLEEVIVTAQRREQNGR